MSIPRLPNRAVDLDDAMRRISTTVNLLCAAVDEKWDDIRSPATAINPPGLASDPAFDTTNIGWLFDHASTELLVFALQFPHGWKEQSVVRPHVHWEKTTNAAGNVEWQLEYKWSPIGGARDAAWTTMTASTSVAGTPDNGSADVHLINSFGDLDTTGHEISDMLLMKLSRIGGATGDTYSADARLLEFDVHYQIDARGSDFQFEKD